jgi:hypothetical protein
MNRFVFVIGLTFAGIGAAACGGAQATAPAMPAADNGQPKMQAAMQALQQAQAELQAASPNKGGHREQALQLVQEAMQDVDAGMQYAAAHPTEVGEAEGPAEPEPVDEEVKDAGTQPHMAQAMVYLREARKQLREAKHDKGGFRAKGLAAIAQAMHAVHEGIEFADHH